jgi:hypothetical protein
MSWSEIGIQANGLLVGRKRAAAVAQALKRQAQVQRVIGVAWVEGARFSK